MSLEKKFWGIKTQKEAQENLLGDNIRSIQNEVLEKQREMDHLKLEMEQEKETDLKVLKIKNELEIKYTRELEYKQSRINELNEHINNLEKQVHLSKYALESQKNDHVKTYEAMKDTNKMKVDSLVKEMALLSN
jgi:hypothetical protein